MLALRGTWCNARRLHWRALSAAAQEVQQDAFFGSKKREVVGAYTPVTKELWLQRWQWTPEMIAAAPPQTEVRRRVLSAALNKTGFTVATWSFAGR